MQFIVMRGRYQRAGERVSNRSMGCQFGLAQREWIFKQLKASQAPFKVVVNDYDIMGSRYSDEITVIAGFIKDHRISGVLFYLGGIHRNEFEQQDHGMAYPVTQIASSGIARNKIWPWAMIDVDSTLEDPPLTVRVFVEEKQDCEGKVRLSEWTP